MVRRYFVDDSDNTISGLTDIDEVEVPTGYSAVLESTIRAVDPPGADGRIRSGSTWDGSTYTAATPDGLLIPYDADTELGQKQIACQQLHNYLINTRNEIQLVAHERIQSHVQHLQEFEAMAHWANYVAAQHDDHHQRPVYCVGCDKMVEGPSGAANLHDLFEQVHGLEDDKIPLEACAWVNPATDATEVVTLEMARGNSTQGYHRRYVVQWGDYRPLRYRPRQRGLDKGANVMTVPYTRANLRC